MKINKYPDGTSYAIADVNYSLTPFKINSYEDLWHLNQYVDAMNSIGIHPNITIPNLIDAQADRRFTKGESFGLGLILKHLVSLNADFTFFHPHNAEVVEMAFFIAGKKCKIMDNLSFITNTLYNISKEYPTILDDKTFKTTKEKHLDTRLLDNLILLSPDAGAFKPMVKLADKLNWQGEVYSASKSREYKEGKSKITQLVDRMDFKGKDIFIIDDICVKGGTFKGLSKLLKERSCGKLYLAVSHMTVQNLGQDNVCKYFDKVFTTNSKYDEYYYTNNFNEEVASQPENLEIIKLF